MRDGTSGDSSPDQIWKQGETACLERQFEHPGKWVTFSAEVDFGWTSFSERRSHPNDIADYLERTYGLDVRRRKTPDSRAKCDLMLAGEWFGRVYLDYVTNPELAKRTHEDER